MYFELKENRPHGTPDNPFSLYRIQNVPHAFQIPVHWHDELEIIFVKKGPLNVTISGENYIGNPGDAFVVSPGNLHFMGSHTGDVDYCTFLFPLEFVSFQTNDLWEQMIMAPLKSGRMIFYTQVGKRMEDLGERLLMLYAGEEDKRKPVRILEQKTKEQELDSLSIQMETKAILCEFIQRMWKNHFIIANDTSGRNATEKEMISYIQENYANEISLKEFGAQFHLSEKYVSRYFKEHFHITLSQYVNHLRLEHARQLLQETQLPVTEVALQSGYPNVSYFIRSFKKMYGVSPLKYRKK